MSTNYGFQPTLDGLNTIDADSSTSSNIVCDTIKINTSGTAPTMAPGNNTTNIATTAFVQGAVSGAGAGYVSLAGNQTLTTGIKTFTNLPESSAVPTTANQLVNKNYVDSAGTNLLPLLNTWTNQNNFKAITINNTVNSNQISLKSQPNPILIANTPSNEGLNGVNFSCATITAPIGNQNSSITISLPFCFTMKASTAIAWTNPSDIFLDAGTLTCSITKNGSAYSTPTPTIYNLATSGTVKRWSTLGSAIVSPIFSAYVGNLNIPITLGINNATADSYVITINWVLGASNTPNNYPFNSYISMLGSSAFTLVNYTHYTNSTATTFIDSDPTTAITTSILTGNTVGNQIIGSGDLVVGCDTNSLFTGDNINFVAQSSFQIEAKTGYWTNKGVSNFYFRASSASPNILLGSNVADFCALSASSSNVVLTCYSKPLSLDCTNLTVGGVYLPSSITYPITNTNAVGYHIRTTTATKMTNAQANLASLTIPFAGCYLVEGNFIFTGASFQVEAFTTVSISATSGTVDITRQQTVYQGNVGGNYAQHISSIINFTSSGTVYFVGLAQISLGAAPTQSNTMAITRIA